MPGFIPGFLFCGAISWSHQLEPSAGAISWSHQLEPSAGAISWSHQLEGRGIMLGK
jgi:hypothetical protein